MIYGAIKAFLLQSQLLQLCKSQLVILFKCTSITCFTFPVKIFNQLAHEKGIQFKWEKFFSINNSYVHDFPRNGDVYFLLTEGLIFS